MNKPNILFLMTDQQRFDTIAALGNSHIYTPNLDRLVRRGLAFTRAYSTCPVCMPARYTVRTGCEPPTSRSFANWMLGPAPGQAPTAEGRCGAYLPRTMGGLGYRTFGIGKFHTGPWDEDLGYEVHLHSEELYGTPDQRARDSYAAWIKAEHPQFDYIEALMGERTEMYYMPQVSPLPAELTVERWAADRAGEQIRASDRRPYFGFVSFVGPHPPFAPPVPFNRMYDPDRMPSPVCGPLDTDHMDEQISWMNRAIWAEEIPAPHARVLKARYYGEISYIDDCIGRILDAVEARPDAGNTLICFFSDHGDMLGDHHAWQKECFFEASCHIPFLVSWPARLPGDQRREELACLTDLFGLATGAAGQLEIRQGVNLLGVLEGTASPREYLIGYYGDPGTPQFKIMVRDGKWKYIFMANGGREQLFDLLEDPGEEHNRAKEIAAVAQRLRGVALAACQVPGAADALDGTDFSAGPHDKPPADTVAPRSSGNPAKNFRRFPFAARPPGRFYQFDCSRGVNGFPRNPADAIREYRTRSR